MSLSSDTHLCRHRQRCGSSAQQLNVMWIAGTFPTARMNLRVNECWASCSARKLECRRRSATRSLWLAGYFESALLQHDATGDTHANGIKPALREVEQM